MAMSESRKCSLSFQISDELLRFGEERLKSDWDNMNCIRKRTFYKSQADKVNP